MKSKIIERPVFEKLLFAQSWEDPELDIRALNIKQGDRVLVVSSGGCNTLNILTEGPHEMIAIDMNPIQSYCLELKLAGIAVLDYNEYLALLGVKFMEELNPSADAIALYDKVRGGMSPPAREYWDRNRNLIRKGVHNNGRFERYVGLFGKLLRVIQGGKTVRELFNQPFEKQLQYYREKWDTKTWRFFFRTFFSRKFLGKKGLDPEFFKYVKGVDSFGEHWRLAAEHVLTELSVRENYFVAQYCYGKYLNRHSVPRYLDEKYFSRLKKYAGRVKIVTEEMEKYLLSLPAESVDKFSLSNIFEWIEEGTYQKMLGEFWRVGSHGAILCYRNLLVYRERPESLKHKLLSHHDKARKMLFYDRSFVYNNFVIEEVVK